MKKIIVLVMLMASLCFASQIADIDFASKINRVDGSGGELSFTRATAAFNRDGTAASSGELRTESVTVASPVTYTSVSTYQCVAVDNDYIYAKITSNLYRKKDGDFQLFYSFPANIVSVYVTSKGSLLVSLSTISGETAGRMYRYADGTWSLVMANTVMTTGCSVASWGWTQCNDMIFAAEYRTSFTADNARCVYMSKDDGATWTKIHNPDNVTGKHLHKITASSINGSINIYAAYGDGSAYGMTKITDNGTSAWTAATVTMNYLATQPTGGVWIPENGTILWGTDGSGKPSGIFQQTLSNDAFSFKLSTEIDNTASTEYNLVYNFLSFKKIGNAKGAIYLAASSKSGSETNYYTGIFASLDGVNWVKVLTYLDTNLEVVGLGIDGNIWCSASTGSIYFSLPSVSNVKGAVIERAGANLFNNTPSAQTGTTGDTAYATTSWDGVSSVRWTGSGITAVKYLAIHGSGGGEVITDMAVGDMAYLTMWLYGTFGDGSGNDKGIGNECKLRVVASIYDGTDAASIAATTQTATIVAWPSSQWQKIVVPIQSAFTHASTKSRMYAHVYAQADTDPYDATFDILVDGISMEKNICPSEYNVQGTNRNADVLYYQPASFPAAFTDIFTFASRHGSYAMGARASGDAVSYIYLRSYMVDADNFFALVYDVTDNKFKLVNEVATVQTVLDSSTAVYLMKYDTVTVGITRNGTSVSVTIWTGGAHQTITGTITDHTVTKSYYGCHPSGTQGGSLVFIRDVMYDEVLTDITDYMEYPALPDTRDTGSQRGWLSNF